MVTTSLVLAGVAGSLLGARAIARSDANKERFALRMAFDVFNVFNVQGLNTPGSDGVVTLQNSYGNFGIRPRQVQVKARLEW